MVGPAPGRPLRLVFCGTPEFAVPPLEAILQAGHDVALVLTQPDRPAGRGLEVRPGPVKRLAEAHGLPVMQPERLRTHDELRARLESIRPDAIVVVAYGRLIPPWMLDLPPLGNINLHGSLLPKYRGAAPIQWAVANGETETGVSTMRLDIGMDTGPVLLERRVPIGADTMAAQLFPELAVIGADLMVETLRALASGTVQPRPQDESQATLAPMLTKEDGFAVFTLQSAQQIYDRWRGFSPWPGVHTRFRSKRFLLHRLTPLAPEAASPLQLAPGELRVAGDDLLVGAAHGTMLNLSEVQLEGKAKMSGSSFARGFQLRAGERLG